MRLTLEQLRIFAAVARQQHVTRGAKSLHLAQSAASAAIANLEAHFDTKLFDRVGRSIVLTEAGRLLLAEATAVLARAESAEQAMMELSGLRRGALLVQASQTIAGYWLPRHLLAFRRAYPDIDVRLSIANTAQVAFAVREGIADLGFVEGDIEDPKIVAESIAKDSLVLVVGHGHPWISRKQVVTADLVNSEWVLREKGSGTRSMFEAALNKAGLSTAALRVTMELPSNDAVRAAVEAGMGATVISASVVASAIEAGLLHRIKFDLPERAFYALRHRERHHGRAAEALLSLIGGTRVKPARKRAPARP